MNVIFRRTGERRYAVVVQVEGQEDQAMNPAPGFDPHIPHDLVHYVVEAEFGFEAGVFGRAARGGGTFAPAAEGAAAPRQRARQRRKQARRERTLGRDQLGGEQLQKSERLAYLSDIAWRRRQGELPNAAFDGAKVHPEPNEAAHVARVVRRLETLASCWSALPVGGQLSFVWPSLEPSVS